MLDEPDKQETESLFTKQTDQCPKEDKQGTVVHQSHHYGNFDGDGFRQTVVTRGRSNGDTTLHNSTHILPTRHHHQEPDLDNNLPDVVSYPEYNYGVQCSHH